MNQKIGRNDSCFCGSGKKYKKCCLEENAPSVTSSEPVDFSWHQLRQLEGVIVDDHLMPYVTQKLPKEVLQAALTDFFPEDLPEALDKEALFHYTFLPWFLFNWIPDDTFGQEQFDPGRTIAQNYLDVYPEHLDSQKKRFIETISHSYYSFYSVLRVEVEKSLLVKDILLGTTHTIKERQGTHQLKRGDIVFSRILTLENQSIFIGMSPFVVPARYQNDMIDFRNWLFQENNRAALTPKVLRNELDIFILEYFFSIMKTLFDKPLPIMTNTDDELIQFSKSYFKCNLPPQEALKFLAPLSLEEDPIDLIQGATKDKSGTIKRIEFPWLAKGNKKHKSWDNTIIGERTFT